MCTCIANASTGIPVSLWGMSFVAQVQFKLLRRLDRLQHNEKSVLDTRLYVSRIIFIL